MALESDSPTENKVIFMVVSQKQDPKLGGITKKRRCRPRKMSSLQFKPRVGFTFV